MMFSPPSSPARNKAAAQHRARRFCAADERNGRPLHHDPFASAEEQAEISVRCGTIEDRLERIEEQLAGLLGSVNVLTSLRQSPRDPATLETSRLRAPARRAATPTGSAPPRRPNSARSTSSSPQKRQLGYQGAAGRFNEIPEAPRNFEIQAILEELQANQASSRLIVDQQQLRCEETERAIVDIRATLTRSLQTMQDSLNSMQINSSESSAIVARDASVTNQLRRLDEDQQTLKKTCERCESKLKDCAGKTAEQGSQVGEVSRALVCLTSDFELLEARFTEQLFMLEAGQERQGRALRGHLATAAGDSVALSSHERVQPRDTKDSPASVSEQATGLVSSLLKGVAMDSSVS